MTVNRKQITGILLVCIGLCLFLNSIGKGLVTLVLDNSPPIIGTTLPSASVNRVFPNYTFVVYCRDPESGIQTVVVQYLDGGTSQLVYLVYVKDEAYDGYMWQRWEGAAPASLTQLNKQYQVIFGVVNKASLTATLSVSYYVSNDFTNPEIGDSTPANGMIYPAFNKITVRVRDLESGILWAKFSYGPKGAPNQNEIYLSKETTFADGWELWSKTSPEWPAGSYDFRFKVMSNSDLQNEISGTFEVYVALQGNWYVNNVLLNSPDQTLYFSSLTVSFRFEWVNGSAPLSSVSCVVKENNNVILTLTKTGDREWTGSYTFSAGTHVLTLEATDGKKYIRFAMVPLTFYDVQVGSNLLQYFGVGLTVLGAVLTFSAKKGKRKNT